MKNIKKLLSLLLALCVLVACFAGCKDNTATQSGTNGKTVDYVEKTKLNMDSDTKKQEVTVKSFIDGDTTHFFVPSDISDDGTLKARNTIENYMRCLHNRYTNIYEFGGINDWPYDIEQ